MKKFLLATAATALLSGTAFAADLPRRAEPPPPVFTPVPVFTWTGFYAGFHTGYAFTDRQRLNTFGQTLGTADNVAAGRRPASVLGKDTDGFTRVGAGSGFNIQLTPGSGVVIGGAFDMTWMDLDKRTVVLGAPLLGGTDPNPSRYTQVLNYLGTINGKIGYAFDRFLVYGSGGFAFGDVETPVEFFNPAGVLQFAGGHRSFQTGYNYGGGIEYAIPEDSFLNYLSVGKWLGIKSNAVTLKAEYIRYELDSNTTQVVPTGLAPAAGSYIVRSETQGSLIRAGFNYKFGGY